MTIVEGQIESLKKLKSMLTQNGITRFNSIGEIRHFTNNYESEKANISAIVDDSIKSELSDLQSRVGCAKHFLEQTNIEKTNQLNSKIEKINAKYSNLKNKYNCNLILKCLYFIPVTYLHLRITRLEKNFSKTIQRQTALAEKKFVNIQKKLDEFVNN